MTQSQRDLLLQRIAASAVTIADELRARHAGAPPKPTNFVERNWAALTSAVAELELDFATKE